MAVVVLVTGLVWAAEILNTAIERLADFVCTEQHYVIKLVKDISAAAVLVSAVTALATGAFIFIPKIF